MQDRINIIEIFNLLKRNLISTIVTMIIGAVASYFCMVQFVDPTYQSQAQLIVNQQSSQEQAIQFNEVQTNIQLINTYRDIILSDAVLQGSVDNIDANVSVNGLRSSIVVNQSNNSQSFTIRAQAGSPQLAQEIVGEVSEQFIETLEDVYGNEITSVHTLSQASYNPNKVAPSTIMYILIGAVLGLIVKLIQVVVKEMTDKTLKDDKILMEMGFAHLGDISSISKKERQRTRIKNQGKKHSLTRRKV